MWTSAPTTVDQASFSSVTVFVVRVVDGDTFIADLPDPLNNTPTTRVRLWGIDAPELARDGKPDEPFAQEATRFANKMLAGERVQLTIEESRRHGHFGRLLAHVQLEDGKLFAEEIVRAGLARADNRWPHRWLERLTAAERESRTRGVGVWSR